MSDENQPQDGKETPETQQPQDGKGKGGSLADLIKNDPERAEREIRQLRREAAAEREKREKLEAERKANDDKALSEQGKYKELADQRQTEIEKLKADFATERLQSKVRDAARALKFNDPDDALVPAVLGKVKADKDGNPEGIEEALKEYVAAKPYLIISTDGAGKPPLPGKMGVTNPANQPGLTQADLKKLTAQEIYAMSQEEVDAALTRKTG
jgi:predicted RNase H-like nuclease (RuvC/YqgF family)